eukprot:s247_g2.t1
MARLEICGTFPGGAVMFCTSGRCGDVFQTRVMNRKLAGHHRRLRQQLEVVFKVEIQLWWLNHPPENPTAAGIIPTSGCFNSTRPMKIEYDDCHVGFALTKRCANDADVALRS